MCIKPAQKPLCAATGSHAGRPADRPAGWLPRYLLSPSDLYNSNSLKNLCLLITDPPPIPSLRLPTRFKNQRGPPSDDTWFRATTWFVGRRAAPAEGREERGRVTPMRARALSSLSLSGVRHVRSAPPVCTIGPTYIETLILYVESCCSTGIEFSRSMILYGIWV